MIFSKKYQISIDTPCQEKWEGMTPMGKGRFCDSCSKNVIDFSVMQEKEIVSFFRNKPLNTCGRFTKEQVDKTYIQRPQFKLPFYQRLFSFLFSLFVSNSIVNKANAQSDSVQVIQNDSLQKLVQADTVLTDSISLVEADTNKCGDSSFVWTTPDIIFTDTFHVDIGMTLGMIWVKDPEPETSFIEQCLASLGRFVNGDSVNLKQETSVSQNDNPKPTKEPVKKGPAISAAVLPEELKRKTNKNLNT